MDTAARLTQVPWKAVGIFTLLSWALAWLALLPLWLGDGFSSPFAIVLTAAMMFTPAISALIVTFTMVKPSRPARFLGFLPFTPAWRSVVLIVIWPVFWAVLGVLAFFLAVKFGMTTTEWFSSDMYHLYGDQITVSTYALVLLSGLPFSTLVSSLTAFGQELGWRGFLASALAPLGFWQSALLTGVIAGVWYSPLIMLGYYFDRMDAAGALFMMVFAIGLTIILQWARYATGNIWTTTIGHGAVNAVIPHTLLWPSGEASVVTSTLLGLPGWMLMGVAIAILALLRQPRRSLELEDPPPGR